MPKPPPQQPTAAAEPAAESPSPIPRFAPEDQSPPPDPVPESVGPLEEELRPGEIRVSRTVVKSEPELAELLAREPRLRDERVEVTLTEKGFGTRVAIVAPIGDGVEHADLEQLLDRLAEPQKRPFSNA